MKTMSNISSNTGNEKSGAVNGGEKNQTLPVCHMRGQGCRVDRSKEEILWANRFFYKELPTIHLDTAGTTYADKNYLIRRNGEAHDSHNRLFVLEYVMSGKGYIEANGIRSTVTAGDLYIVDGRFTHQYYADSKDPFEKKWINVRGSFLNSVIPLLLQENPYLVMSLGGSAEMIMDQIHNRIRRTTPTDSNEMLGYIMKKIVDLFILIDTERKKAQDTFSRQEKIVRYIEQNICLDIHVSDLCESFYISASTLYRLFMTCFGMSPKDFIMAKKVEMAQRMISDNESSFSAIASALHFYDSRHFARTFKKYTGVSPAEYKNRILPNG